MADRCRRSWNAIGDDTIKSEPVFEKCMWRVVFLALLVAAAPSVGAVLTETDDDRTAASEPGPGTSCSDPYSLAGLRLDVPRVSVLFTGTEQLSAGGDRHFWEVRDLSTGDQIVPSFRQSGFSEPFEVLLHLQTDDGCEEVEPMTLSVLEYPYWEAPEDGVYLIEVRAPPNNGGSYQLELVTTPA